MARLFDPVAFLNADLDANATKRDPNPEGTVLAQVTKLGKKAGTGKDGNEWNRLDVSLEVTDPEYLANVVGQPQKVVMTLGIMLDMNGDQIATGPNKNVRLGKFREACGVNGKPLAALVGQMVQITVIQKPHHENPEDTVDEISAFAAPE